MAGRIDVAQSHLMTEFMLDHVRSSPIRTPWVAKEFVPVESMYWNEPPVGMNNTRAPRPNGSLHAPLFDVQQLCAG
jgi:hypothetical protein